MSTATAIRKYLADHHVRSEMTPHAHTATAMDAADAAHVNADCVAKAVMVGDEHGCMMAVIPASHQVRLKELRRATGRNLHLMREREFSHLFPDCDLGAVPAIGQAYGMELIWDDCLAEQSDVYFEAGDHEALMRVKARDFVTMMHGSPHGCISSHR